VVEGELAVPPPRQDGEPDEPASPLTVSDQPDTGAQPGERPRWFLELRPYPFEIAAWAGLLAAILFLRARDLRIDRVAFDYTIPPLIPVLAKFVVVGVGLYLAYTLLRRSSPLAYLKRLLDWRWLLLSLRLWLTFAVLTFTYFWLKVCVPLVNPRLWDQALWRLDAVLHLGFSPSLFMVEAARGTLLAPMLDRWYGWWLLSISLSLAFFCSFPTQLDRRRFLFSCVILWTAGAWIYVALPALGPIYAFHDIWREILPQIPLADSAHQLLWDNYQRVLAGRESGQLRAFKPALGIAAMPSLHVGGHWLLMLWARRLARPLFLPAAVGTLLTFLGSLVTGWHYALDGYIGIALAQSAYLLALYFERDRQGSASVTETSSGQPAAERAGG
jgi:hypothetical protein